ncbi:MAG: response regulator transcription factor, partial [Thermoanaerobaculia bacterium]|nr:response regulator transcription factor [Thermoanaerobaculia bacterium]
MPIRILIADDHSVVRSGLRALLAADPDIFVAGEAADSVEVMQLAERLQPDLVLLDITMPQENGIKIAQ